MKRFASVIFLVGMTFGVQEISAQEFWYVPPGLDYGYRSGVNLGNGVGFGYGIGVGFKGNSGTFAPATPVIRQEQNSAITGSTNNTQKTLYNKTTLLKQSQLKQQMQSERMETAKAEARMRNLRYLQYLESQAAALR